MQLIVAFPCEARPIVDRFRLRALTGSTSLRVFGGSGLLLAVSGVGKTRAAAATGYLHGLRRGRRDDGWINAVSWRLEVGGNEVPNRSKGVQGLVHLIVALPCEARPIVDRFRLRALTGSTSLRVFGGSGLLLAVSGVGKTRAAAATGYLHGLRRGRRDDGWINVGIAGEADRPVGEAVLAHRVIDRATGRSHYPAFAFRPPCPTGTLITVDRPEREHPEGAACDMEASGFLEAAARCSSAELVHCLKVISDNRAAPPQAITPPAVEALIAARLDLIASLIETVGGLSKEARRLAAVPAGMSEVLARHHFTFSERHRLRRLLRRHRALAGGPPAPEVLAGARSARQALESLERAVGGLPPPYRAGGDPPAARSGGDGCST